jgi:hypothetical protein
VSICLTSSIYHLPKEPKQQTQTKKPAKKAHKQPTPKKTQKANNIHHKALNSAKVRERVQPTQTQLGFQ